MFDNILFWLLLLIIGELLITKETHYLFSLVMSIILLLCILLFAFNLDLFASILIVLYSSVFIFLSLFLLSFENLWGNSRTSFYDKNLYLDLSIILSIILAIFFMCPTSVDSHILSFKIYQPSWNVFNVNILLYDYYNILLDMDRNSVVIMHNLIYKNFLVETVFMNVYILLGLVLVAILILYLKSIKDPNLIIKLLSISRLKYSFFKTRTSKIHTISKFRRQLRRKNNSNIKFK